MAQQKTEQWLDESREVLFVSLLLFLLFFRFGEGTIGLYTVTPGNNPTERRSWRVWKARRQLRNSHPELLSTARRREHTGSITLALYTGLGKKMILIFPNSQGHEDGKPWEFKMLKDAYSWTLYVWDSEVLSASKTILLTDLLTIPFKNPQIQSVFSELFLLFKTTQGFVFYYFYL